MKGLHSPADLAPNRLTLAFYLLTVLLFTCIFVGLHFLANQVSTEFVAKKLAYDFNHYNLSEHNYPFSIHGSHSVLSNIGQNQYTECAVLLSLLAPAKDGIKGAVLPSTIHSQKHGKCKTLKKSVSTINNGGDVEVKELRPRYWWGARPVYSLMLRYFSVYQAKEIIRNMTTVAYIALAIALFHISASLFWISAPLLLFGSLFSGITYYSDVILGVPYLWALVAATSISSAWAIRLKETYIHLVIFCTGIVSSYLWLLDGHLMLLIAWLILIGYFSAAHTKPPINALLSCSKQVAVFGCGFLSTYLSGLLIKSYYLGVDAVWQSFSSAVVHRSSDIGPGSAELSMSIVLDKVWNIGYWWTGLWRHELLWLLVIWGSLFAACVGCVVSIARAFKGDFKNIAALAICLLVIVSVFARLYFLQNHSVIHAFFIGRYMFIPLAMCWAMLLVSFIDIQSRFSGENKVSH